MSIIKENTQFLAERGPLENLGYFMKKNKLIGPRKITRRRGRDGKVREIKIIS